MAFWEPQSGATCLADGRPDASPEWPEERLAELLPLEGFTFSGK